MINEEVWVINDKMINMTLPRVVSLLPHPLHRHPINSLPISPYTRILLQPIMADFSAVFNSVPPVTRFLLLGTAVVTGYVDQAGRQMRRLISRPCLLGLLTPYHVRRTCYDHHGSLSASALRLTIRRLYSGIV
jgi:hypothetical protein